VTFRLTALVATVVLGVGACGVSQPRSTLAGPPSGEVMAQFWVDPGGNRDLYWGAWGKRHAPNPDVVYTFEASNSGGFSPKWDVSSPDGRKWGAKMGPEAQAEVTTSRILWGVGYHQPPNYYLERWRVDNGKTVQNGSPARFRPEIDQLDKTGEWAWAENPFADTVQYRGLLVLLAMLNSADLKDNNNGVYELPRRMEGARRWFLVRDVGSSLGTTGWSPRRNDIDEFEKTGFILGVADGYLQLDVRGRFTRTFERLRPADARWISERLQRLTPRQWRDAFRAGGYDQPTTGRYLRVIRQKIEQGLAAGRADRPGSP
jgi:hypothetical protein